MEQHLRLYRNHTPACTQGHTKPSFDGDKTPDCSCPINAEGRLRNVVKADGTLKRIQHRTLGKNNQPVKDWAEARIIRGFWLEWGQFEQPSGSLEGKNVTVAQAVDYFVGFHQNTEQKAAATQGKYDVFLNKRLSHWCETNGKRMMKDFDNPIVVKNFFMSWRNLQPNRGKGTVLTSDVPLGRNTKVHELERFRTFLEFCRNNKWIESNFAKAPHIKLGAPKVKPKYGFRFDEWEERIKPMLDNWQSRYHKANPARKLRLKAFVHALRFLGQRLSDVTMLGPHSIVEDNGNHFIALTQIKTGAFVKVPLTRELLDMLRSLPVYGETPSKFMLVRRDWTITYGTQFWFWTANVPEGADEEKKNQVVESAAKNWSDEVSAMLKRTEKEFKGKFEHPSTPHTFRHTFAITMLIAKRTIQEVAAWLGDSPDTVQRHYAHANADWHDQSHKSFMEAMDIISRTTKAKRKLIPMQKVG